MDFLPWTTFTRIVDRYGGDHRVRTLSCAEQYRSMAFAQLTYRESLRDIETCLSVHASKLYHMGFRQPVRRSTLADANERRDWRIHAALAQRLITQARTLYVDEELGLDLTNTVYALDSTTIALCLSVFPWAHFRTTKAAVKMHTLLDLRGNIPSFIHISDGKLHDVHALDMLLPEAGAIYVVDRGYVDFARLYVLHQAGAFFVGVPSRTSMLIASIRRRRIARPASFATRPSPWTASTPVRITPNFCGRIRFKDPESGKTLVFITNNFSLPAATICALYKSRWQVELYQVDQAASSDQAVLRHVGERGEDADLDCRLGLRPRRHRQEAPRPGRLALHFVTDPLGDPLRENGYIKHLRETKQMQRFANNQPKEFIRSLKLIRLFCEEATNGHRRARLRQSGFDVVR